MTVDDPMKWAVRVSLEDRQQTVVYARKSRFLVGPALIFDEQDRRTSALEYLLGAIGADLVAGMKESCRRRRLQIDNIEAVVEGTLNNPPVHLGVVGEQGHPGLDHLAIKVFVGTFEEEEDIQQVWKEMVRRSPLYQTFSKLARLDLRLKVVL